MNILNINREFNLELCKVNREVIGVIDSKTLKSINKSLLEPNSLEIEINKFVYDGGIRIINPIWYELKEERLVCLNNKEYYVLKRNSFSSSENKKSFTAYSLEYKLTRIDVNFENIAIRIFKEDDEAYSINNLLKNETGWEFGEIEEHLIYDNVNNQKVEKIRWQESVNKRWYDYITDDICTLFNAIAIFDTLNKRINLYDINTFGENIELYLSKDNYVKSIERTSSSENLVTRLNVVGSEEMDIIGATASGYKYIEDFSYFYDDMSLELYNDLMKYYEMVEIRTPIWKNLINTKNNKLETLYIKKSELYITYEEIRANKSVKKSYDANEDLVNSAIIADKITKLIDKKIILEVEVKNLEKDILNLEESIRDINILCKKETATDENGNIIFNNNTLNELKEFVYTDTFTNDSFIEVNDLINASKRELSFLSSPEISYSFDLENFIKNIKSNNFNINFDGNLGIGDIIILKDEDLDKEVFLYVNSYTQYPNGENELDIVVSNKKLSNSNKKVISDRFTDVKFTKKTLAKKVNLLNKQKYNTINLDKNQVGGTI